MSFYQQELILYINMLILFYEKKGKQLLVKPLLSNNCTKTIGNFFCSKIYKLWAFRFLRFIFPKVRKRKETIYFTNILYFFRTIFDDHAITKCIGFQFHEDAKDVATLTWKRLFFDSDRSSRIFNRLRFQLTIRGLFWKVHMYSPTRHFADSSFYSSDIKEIFLLHYIYRYVNNSEYLQI